MSTTRLSHSEILELRRWNTPTIYNGWEQITSRDAGRDGVNIDEATDFMPQMGAMVGYAVTVVIEPSNAVHKKRNPDGWADYRKYLASIPGPKIVCVQDLEKPRTFGSMWGEVNANVARALGCVGAIVDGGIRDIDEMNYAGFKALARRLCVGHAHVVPIKCGCAVEVFGRKIEPGQLIHADKHGFLAIPPEDEKNLLEAARFMDSNECKTLIAAARECAGLSTEQALAKIEAAAKAFGDNTKAKFARRGEF